MALDLTPDGLPTWQDSPLFLPPKESAVLALMIRAQPLAVSKADIIEHAWGGAVVSDDSLARCISQLRRALPDVKIEAVYGFGYRLVPPEPTVHNRMLAVVKAPPDVVEAYLHAWELAQHGTPRAMGRALTVLRAIVAEYPDYAPARVSLAVTIGAAAGWGMAAELGVTVADGQAELDAAERQDPHALGLRVARAWLADMDWRFDDAEALFRAAYREQPDDAELLPLFGWHLLATGRSGEAVEVLRRAVAQRPFAVYPRVARGRARRTGPPRQRHRHRPAPAVACQPAARPRAGRAGAAAAGARRHARLRARLAALRAGALRRDGAGARAHRRGAGRRE
jgi:tetratricopeptide (TPR) repeat protein